MLPPTIAAALTAADTSDARARARNAKRAGLARPDHSRPSRPRSRHTEGDLRRTSRRRPEPAAALRGLAHRRHVEVGNAQ